MLSETKEWRREYMRAWRARNPEKDKIYGATESAKAARRKRYATKPEIQKRAGYKYRAKYPDREAARRNRYNAERKAGLRRRPAWADKDEIKAIYAVAAAWRKAGLDAEVDHIVPLTSKYVSGFHAGANLTILLAAQNNRKRNTSWPDMP